MVTKYLEKNKEFKVLEWVAQSPDMNPIENAWKKLKDAIFQRATATSIDDVFDIVHEEWNNLPFQNLILAMPRRVKALRQKQGKQY